MKLDQKGFSFIKALIIAIIVMVVLTVILYALKPDSSSDTLQESNNSQTQSTTSSAAEVPEIEGETASFDFGNLQIDLPSSKLENLLYSQLAVEDETGYEVTNQAFEDAAQQCSEYQPYAMFLYSEPGSYTGENDPNFDRLLQQLDDGSIAYSNSLDQLDAAGCSDEVKKQLATEYREIEYTVRQAFRSQ